MSKPHGLMPTQSIELFDWEARWESNILPVLDRPKVKQSIEKYKKERWTRRAPRFKGTSPCLPYQLGREPDEGWKEYTATELRAYAPLGECHWIHPFCKRVAEQFYPHLRWGVIRGDLHTTTVGCVPGEQGFPYFPGFGRVVVVSDILLSCGVGDWTAENCIAYALFSKFCCEGLDERVIIARQEDATYNEILEILSVIEDVFYLNVNSNTAKVMEALSNGQLTLAEKVSRW